MSAPPPAAAISSLNLEFAKVAYQKQLKKRRHEDNGKGCHIPKKQPRDDGYCRFEVTKAQTAAAFGVAQGAKTYYIHTLAWYATGKSVPADHRSEHLSHRCGDSRCFNPAHLVPESAAANNARKGCIAAVRCPCPCKQAFWVCTHKPRCIPPTDLVKELPQATDSVFQLKGPAGKAEESDSDDDDFQK
jgi:hypothetical protein